MAGQLILINSDLKYIVNQIITDNQNVPTMNQINNRWQWAITHFGLLERSIGRNRIQRASQMTWRTAKKLLRTYNANNRSNAI